MELREAYVEAYVGFHALAFPFLPAEVVLVRVGVIAAVLSAICRERSRYPALIQGRIPAVSLVSLPDSTSAAIAAGQP